MLLAHNASFDRRFVRANLERHGYQRLVNRVVCTARLARKLLPRDELPNVRLATLAAYLGATVAPATGPLPTPGRPSTSSTACWSGPGPTASSPSRT